MTRSVLIVGAGPAAAGAALACVAQGVKVTVLDVGGRLEDAHERARARLAATSPDGWAREDIRTITRQPVASRVDGLPEKRAYGSDFPFRDFGQLEGVTARDGVNAAVVSGAYGGFSNVWGAQAMPFTEATFRDWPFDAEAIRPHYERILRSIPYTGEEDDLEPLFPLLAPAHPLPALAERSEQVLARYRRRRTRFVRRGVLLGRARLAMNGARCARRGLCLTGCPYKLVYSASHTFDELIRTGQITYRGGLLAVDVADAEGEATVTARDLRSGRLERFSADRVLLGCGAIGTTRLVLGSLKLFDTDVPVAESAQFVLPFVSARPTADPRDAHDFTLNQFNMVVSLDGDGHDVSQLHFYTFNPAFVDALPGVLRRRALGAVRGALLRRLSVALGYLPSWASPSFTVRAAAGMDPGVLPALTVGGGLPSQDGRRMLRAVLARVARSAPDLDLWPLLAQLQLPAPGKSYHFGATFPHAADSRARLSSDTFGRVAPWQRVHLVDASVFPTVPATTFTLTIMANAHRIADSALKELD